MCIVCVAHGRHGDFPLVLCSNRDEDFMRHRRSKPPTHDAAAPGVVCGIDERSRGTWLGVDASTGRFATVTNCGDRTDGVSRGLLVQRFIERGYKYDDFAKFNSFNCLWGNLFEPEEPLSYLTNHSPQYDAEKWEAPLPLEPPTTYAMANDRLGDEDCKTPWLERAVDAVLDDTPVLGAAASREDLEAAAHALTNRLGAVLCRDDTSPLFSWRLLAKFLFFSRYFGRKVQPGLEATLRVFPMLLVVALLVTGLRVGMAVVLAAVPALLVGWFVHVREHTVFVRLWPLSSLWPSMYEYGTVSQTILIATRRGDVHYAYRDTSGAEAGPWHRFTIRGRKRRKRVKPRYVDDDGDDDQR